MSKNFRQNRFVKLILIVFTAIMSASLLFYINNFNLQKNMQEIAAIEIGYIKSIFFGIEDGDTKILSANLEALIQIPDLKKLYLEGDRERLYESALPSFEKLKNKYGITHWYFISPNGRIFLRLHNRDFYGDEITRHTFWQARDFEEISSGLELGKTAYALRVVAPYYDGEELIGYMELGEEIDHFLRILKNDTGYDFAFAASKNLLDEEKWRSVREVAGLRNNWDDLREYLIINSTGEQEIISQCVTEKNLGESERGKILFQQVEVGDEVFKCAGFALFDARGEQSGMFLSLIDIGSHLATIKSSNQVLFVFAAMIFIFIALLLCWWVGFFEDSQS